MATIKIKNTQFRNYLKTILSNSFGTEKEGLDEILKQLDEENTIEEIYLSKVTSLKLDNTFFSNEALAFLPYFKNLKSLSLNNYDIDNRTMQILNKLYSLNTLSISNSQINIEGNGINDSLTIWQNLNNLVFENCTNLDLRNFQQFDILKQNIRNLTVINCKNAYLSTIYRITSLKNVNLANNEWLQYSDISNLISSMHISSLDKVILDGSNPELKNNKNIQYGIERNIISFEDEYTPNEPNWKSDEYEEEYKDYTQYLSDPSAQNFSDIKDYNNIENKTIHITPNDFKKYPNYIAELSQNNTIDLVLQNTAEITTGQLEELRTYNINKVFVQTGWQVTQDRGYSFESFIQIKHKINEIIKDINPNASDMEKYLKVREKLLNIRYNYSALHSSSKESDYYTSRNLEDGLLNGTCVCAGYADILKNVLVELGIEAIYIEGYTNTRELHAWNQIKLKDENGQEKWYNDDITWDAVSHSSGKKSKTYNTSIDYFTQNPTEFSKTHEEILIDRSEANHAHECVAAAPNAILKIINSNKNLYDDAR